jgi:hypothetical protein
MRTILTATVVLAGLVFAASPAQAGQLGSDRINDCRQVCI